MKNLTNRSKILLGIAGLVIVVVIAGLVLLAPGEAGLFGSTLIHISPENATINVHDQLDMSINSVGTCSWSSLNTNVVDINYFDPDHSRQVTMWAVGPGTATIKANCITNHYTTVTVRTPPAVTYNPPPDPVTGELKLHVGQTMTATVGTTGTNCTWAAVCGSKSCSWYANNSVSFNPVTGNTTTIMGVYAGYGTLVIPTCDNGQATGYSGVYVIQ